MHRVLPCLLLCLAGCGRVGFELQPGDQVVAGDRDGGTGGRSGAGGDSSGATGGMADGGDGDLGAGTGAIGGGGPGTDMGGGGMGMGTGGMGTGGIGTGGMDAAMLAPFCDELPHLAQAPVVDGVMEPGLALEYVVPVGWREPNVPLPAGHEMHFAAAWRNDGLYFFVEVIDPDRNVAPIGDFSWAGDAVELYVDHDGSFDTAAPDYDNPGTRQFFAVPAGDGGSPAARGEHRYPEVYETWTGPWTVQDTVTGYVVEAFVQAADLGLGQLSLSAGQTVGIDLAHDVSRPPGETGPDGARLSQYFLAAPDNPQSDHDYPFYDESAFCTPVLLAP